MTSYNIARHNSSHAAKSSNFATDTRANFARAATIDSFGWRFAKALDQAGFIDRLPGDLPMSSPGARLK